MTRSVSVDLKALRRAAAGHTLFAPTDLATAIDRLQFVQADPIRAPARAQDLILRQRVVRYRAGDLERAYPALPLVEDMVHVYGFLHRSLRGLLHPRRIARRFTVEDEHPHLRRAILDHLGEHGSSHPRAIERALGERYPRVAMINAWGGRSNATTRMLNVLQYRGALHVARRERGIRVYALAAADSDSSGSTRLSPQQRADGLIALLVRLYAPLSRTTLMQLTVMLGERAIARDALRARIPLLQKRGTLRSTRVDGVDYLWPVVDAEPDENRTTVPTVRFLAPFDPLVWDRRRFEHLWGWPYRFEAYVPPPKRRLGYYALPLLWQTEDDANVVGWVNATRSDAATRDASRRVSIDAGYAARRPAGAAFRDAFDAEVARLERFLGHDAERDDERDDAGADEAIVSRDRG